MDATASEASWPPTYNPAMRVGARWVFAFAALLSAQDNVIRVDARLVQVNVVAHAKDGSPVADLTKDDFTVLDNGKPQKLSFFAAERLNTAQPTAGQSLPANTFSNDPAYSANRPSNLTIVLLDGTNTKLADQSFARKQLAKFPNQLNPDDKVAVYVLGNSLRIVQDFTSDSAQLARVLDKNVANPSAELAAQGMKAPAPGIAAIDAILREMDAAFADRVQANRIRRTYEALTAIADHVAQAPGRKNLVWLSGAFPLSMGSDDPRAFRNPRREKEAFAEERESATRALVKANVAIYPVDARGLIGAPPSMNADTSSSGRTRTSLPAAVIKEAAEGIDTMEELASATGGRAFHDTNDLTAAVRAAVNDSVVTYTLGFYPDPGRLDGKFHELNVKLKRKGVNVRYRRGYVAYSDAVLAPELGEFAIKTALWSPLQSTGIELVARAERANTPEPNVLQLAVVADAHQLRITQNGGRWTGKIDVTFAQLDPEGRLLDSKRDVVNLHLDPAMYADIMKTGLLLTRSLKPAETAHQIRVVVYDHLTGAIGGLIIPIAGVR